MIEAQSGKEFSAELLAWDISPDELMPKIQKFIGKLVVQFHIARVPIIDIAIHGFLVDVTNNLFKIAGNIEVPKKIDFGNVFTIIPGKIHIPLRNPTRRNVNTKLFVDREYRDIFVVDESSVKVVLRAKSNSSTSIRFCPKIAVSYNSQAFMETDLGSSTISLTGTGVDAIMKATCENLDFGMVDREFQEFRLITIKNPTPLGMPFRFKSNNDSFTFDPCESYLHAGQERTVMIMFLPKAKLKTETCLMEIFLLEIEEEINDYDLTEYSLRNEVAMLKTMNFQGTGGTFGITADGRPVTSDRDQISELTSVGMSFPKVNVRSKLRKSFVVENTGDVPMSFQITDKHGNILGDKAVISDKGVLSCTVKAGSIKVAPKSKETIFFTIEVN